MSNRSHHGLVRQPDVEKDTSLGWVRPVLIMIVTALLAACTGKRDDSGFRLFDRKEDANPAIWPALSTKGIDAVADPGEPCELGCVRFGLHPDMCLLFGGQSSRHAFLVYRQGTIFLRTMLVVFELHEDNAKIAWQGDLGSYSADGIPGLREAIEAGMSRERDGVEGRKLFKADGARTGVSTYVSPPSEAGSECPETND